MSDTEVKIGMIEVMKKIEEDSNYSSRRHFNAGGLFKLLHYVLGIGGVILGAAAGVSVFFSGVLSITTGGIFIITSSVFMGILTFLGPGELSFQHLRAGNEYLNLKKDGGYALSVLVKKLSTEDLDKELQTLRERALVLDRYNGVLWTPRMAFYRARKDIRKGYNDYDFQEQKESV